MFSTYFIGAIQLFPQSYSDIAADRGVTKQAFILAILSSIATGVGSVDGYPEKIPLAALFAFVAWFTWVLLIYILGTKVLREPGTKVEIGALFRVAGFASLPGLIRVLAYLPPFAVIVSAGSTIWMLAMMLIGVQQSFACRRMSRVIAVTLLSWPLYQWMLSQV